MHLVKKINCIDGYKISLTFNDNKTKIVDLESYLDKGVFLPLKNLDYFKKVKLTGHTLVWPNDADFCPDVLYEIGKDIQKNKKSAKSVVKHIKQAVPAMSKKPLKKSKNGY